MQKRIFLLILGGILFAAFLLSSLLTYMFFHAARNQEIAAIQDKSYLIADILNETPSLIPERLSTSFEGSRITILTPDGIVLLDSHAASWMLDPRYDRAEFQEALSFGWGEDIRVSTVFERETYYYALRLNNDTVLRISRPLNTLSEAFRTTLPALFGVLALSFILTYFITQKQISVQKTEQQRREFSANVSHELKTPLTTISALSEMMENGMAKPEDFTSFAAKISAQSKRLIAIIEDIIRLSEFDEKKVRREYSTFDVYALAGSVITDLNDRASKRKIVLTQNGTPVQINANQRLVEELLVNLLENGIKYNKEEGQVTVLIEHELQLCKISVSDTGIGIPKSHQKHIFERFYRVDHSRARNTGGTGLGLSIVKHIVEHHKGSISIESVEHVGTNITCFFPLNT